MISNLILEPLRTGQFHGDIRMKKYIFITSILCITVLSCINLSAQEASGWDLAVLDTARNVEYLSDIEKDIILELNKARTNPQLFAEQYVVPMKARFDGRRYQRPGQIDVMTNEGVNAVNECIRALSTYDPVSVMQSSEILSLAAADHVEDQGPRGATGHTGSDGSTFRTRVERHGRWDIYIGENITYGPAEANEIVTQLLVDDGVRSRGHRENIMNSKFLFVGTAVGPHAKYEIICVMDFAGDVEK